MFTAMLFTIAKLWKKVKCPLTDEWIKKMGHTHIMKDYSAIQKNEFLPLLTTWMGLEGIIPSEINQMEKQIPYISFICGVLKNKTEIDSENKLVP